ncbi:MAG: hypothetical protein ACN2B6_09720 [Rickettsiales bacterium]
MFHHRMLYVATLIAFLAPSISEAAGEKMPLAAGQKFMSLEAARNLARNSKPTQRITPKVFSLGRETKVFPLKRRYVNNAPAIVEIPPALEKEMAEIKPKKTRKNSDMTSAQAQQLLSLFPSAY